MVKDAAEFGRQALVAFESLVVHPDGECEHSIHDNISIKASGPLDKSSGREASTAHVKGLWTSELGLHAGIALVNSRDVAETFGIEHRHVLLGKNERRLLTAAAPLPYVARSLESKP
jgi:hypothetical protein